MKYTRSEIHIVVILSSNDESSNEKFLEILQKKMKEFGVIDCREFPQLYHFEKKYRFIIKNKEVKIIKPRFYNLLDKIGKFWTKEQGDHNFKKINCIWDFYKINYDANTQKNTFLRESPVRWFRISFKYL